jgi:putative flippase GtrA
MSSLHPADRLGTVTDELSTTLELPASARTMDRVRSAYRRGMYEVRHPENHKQAVRFLCVGASGYFVNLVSFFVCIHWLKISDGISLVVAFLIGSSNNFWWNRHWTFVAKEEHAGRQAVRFFAVSTIVFLFATGIYTLIVHGLGFGSKVTADGIAWIIAMPFSFLAQKLWSFKDPLREARD